MFESLCFKMASCSKPGKDNKASYKTALKWEKEFGTKFNCDFHGKDIICIWCTVCGKWEKLLHSIKNFSYPFIRPGTVSAKKDTIKIHCLSEPHKVANNLEQKRKMEAQPYLESVIQDTPIGKAIKKMCTKDKSAYWILFNSACYLVKQERPFSDFPDLLKLQGKVKRLE